MYQTIFNSLSDHIAILDEDGIIIETNRAWQEEQENGADGECGSAGSPGKTYLSVWADNDCDQNSAVETVSQGLQKILQGEITEFAPSRPCYCAGSRRWFTIRLFSCSFTGGRRILAIHEDITHLIVVQEELQDKNEELDSKTRKLKATNIALTIMMEHRNREMRELEQRIARNIQDLIQPYLGKLKKGKIGYQEEALIEIMEINLRNITQPFLYKLASLHSQLSPQQMEIASLIRQGKSSQEIAALLGLSVNTISFHRRNLRRKLGLHDRSKNLRAFLLSLH